MKEKRKQTAGKRGERAEMVIDVAVNLLEEYNKEDQLWILEAVMRLTGTWKELGKG